MDIGTVLVTGGAGFIGCALADRMAESATRWVVLDSLHPQVHEGSRPPARLSPAAELVVSDVTDSGMWDDLLGSVRPDVVIHLAAETGTAQSLDEASRHSRVNVVGTTELTDALGRSEHLPGHIVLSSSRAVYGEGNWMRSTGELFQPGQRTHEQLEAGQWSFPDSRPVPSSAATTSPSPTSVYGATKLAQENILSVWGGARGVSISILRLQNVYGPGQSLTNSYTGIVSLFSQWAREGKRIPLYEDGLIGRDFVFIDDVADAFSAAVTRGPDSARPVLDIGSGTASTISDMAHAIARYYDAPEPAVNGRYRDGDVRSAACEITAAAAALGWAPQFDLDRGVERLQHWIEEELSASETPSA